MKGWTKEFVAEGQRQERRKRAIKRVAKENPEHVGRAARQDTLQLV